MRAVPVIPKVPVLVVQSADERRRLALHYGIKTASDGWAVPKKHWHFCRQLWLRYGVTLEFGQFSDLKRKIERG